MGEAGAAPWSRIVYRGRQGLWLLRHGFGRALARAVRVRLHSRTESLGLRCDLTRPLEIPPARVTLEVRPRRPDDDLSFLAVGRGERGGEAQWRLSLVRLLETGVPGCWVAAEPGRAACYVQWLLTPEDASHITAEWADLFPPLGPGEWLCEGAYTANAYRGKGVMAHAIGRTLAAARDAGARRAIGFVRSDNVASLKACRKAGFTPYLERAESWTLFRRRVSFRTLAEGAPYPFEAAPASR